MGIKDKFDDLFEEAKREEDAKKEIAEIHAKFDLEKIDGDAEAPKDDGHERREFSRIDLEEKHIAVAFDTELQFAKHYIQNISLGGLFIKTSDKFKFGEIIPIQFKVRNERDGEEDHFVLKGRVCRILDSGVGLEFTNLDDETRGRLEKYVKSVLPEGLAVRTTAKQSTIQRLKDIRERKFQAAKRRKQLSFQAIAILSLLAVNAYFVTEVVQDEELFPESRTQTVVAGGEVVPVNEIRSVQRDELGLFHFQMADGRVITPSLDELEKGMPKQLRVQMKVLKTKKPPKKLRRSLNNKNHR